MQKGRGRGEAPAAAAVGAAVPQLHLAPRAVGGVRGVVGQEGSMILPWLDNMGNRCIQGGAQLTVTVGGTQAKKKHSRN